MPTIKLLRGSPAVKIIDGKRILQDECVIDLGELVPELHTWALERGLFLGGSNPNGWVIAESGHRTTILRAPKGFRYDGASIPWFTHPIMGDKEKYEDAGLFHDVLYQLQAPRGASDRVFWLIARSGSKSVGPKRSWFGWAGLRVGGWVAWNGHMDGNLDIVK